MRRIARVGLLSAASACSLTTYDYTSCDTNADCRDAFGFGYVCGDEGLCAEVEVEPRCERTWPVDLFTRVEDYRDAIVLGSVYDQSFDMPETQASQLAIMQVNDLSGLDGRAYALVECSYGEDTRLDTRTREEAAAYTAEWLADTLGVPALIGPATSSTAEAVYYAAAPADAVVISPSATSPALSTIDGLTKTDEAPGLFWRTAPPDSLQGEVVAVDMLARKTANVAVIYATGSYGEGLAQVFTAEFAARGGGTVTLHAFSDATERAVALAAAAAAAPDEVLFIAAESADVSAFLNAAAVQPAYADLPIFLTDSARDEEVLQDTYATAFSLFDQVRGTAPSVPQGDVYAFFSGAYSAEFAPDVATDSVYTAHAWDAAWLAIYGVAWAAANEDAITGTGIARGLRQLSAGTYIPINPTNWTEVRARFDEGAPVDVTGASGPLDFDPDTEETTASIDVWEIDVDGRGFTTTYTTEP